MKFTRFESEGVICQGVVEKENIREITGDLFTKWEYTGRTFIREDVKLLAPIQPNQIIGIGANYVKDVSELPEKLPDIPVFFFKPISSVIGPGEDIIIPEGIEEVKFESELAVVIGKEAKNFQRQMFVSISLAIRLEMTSQHRSLFTRTATGRWGNHLIHSRRLVPILKPSWILQTFV